nr:reverse transcriptase domain-containing protein [Tanacetum cinerariifolium]
MSTSHKSMNMEIMFKNGVVERRICTFIEAACTMLIFSKSLEFLYAKAIATAFFTQNRTIVHTRLKIFSGKLKSRWSGPFTISEIYPYGTAKLVHPDCCNFKVNFHRLKHYHGGDPPPLEIPDVQTFPKDN